MELASKVYELGNLRLEYIKDKDTGQIAMLLLPAGRTQRLAERRRWLKIPEMVRLDMDKTAWEVGSLVHLSYSSCPQGKGAGETLKHGPGTHSMHFQDQYLEEKGERKNIITVLKSEYGCRVKHTVSYSRGDEALEVWTEFFNDSDQDVRLDFLTSVSLDNLSPFAVEDSSERIILHRFYGGWSLEGKHREDRLEELNLERSWNCAFPESEKFGSVGSYPVHRYFPTACVEDRVENVFWGIQLEAPSSWQMELSRDSDCCSFSAGIADVEFGNWSKLVRPGTGFKSTKAYISVGESLDDVCGRLLEIHHKMADKQPECEQSLPIIYNDWCATYGEPCLEKTLKYAEKLKGTPVRYIVIDAGWTESLEKSFGQVGNGDWIYSERKFPGGIKAAADQIAQAGFQLGIWFELEVTTEGAEVYGPEYDHMHLTRDGCVINTGGDRTFWDFRKKETVEYLRKKVIEFLIDNHITYLKVDYNSSIGIGCDGAESPGEGLRQQLEAVQDFFRELRERIPDLVIENCAAGGHRLEASFMDLAAVSTFSDAHECRELPCVAANLQRLVLARQNLVFVVINEYLTEKEIYYRLASGFLGRFCLSGDIDSLSGEMLDIVRNSLNFYGEITEIIKYGKAYVHRTSGSNMHHLTGIQIVERRYGNQCLTVIHSFSEIKGVSYPIGKKHAAVRTYQGRRENDITLENGILKINRMGSDEGVVMLITE